jgi:hypothetical protein
MVDQRAVVPVSVFCLFKYQRGGIIAMSIKKKKKIIFLLNFDVALSTCQL